MYSYIAYGLRVASELELPNLIPSNEKNADLRIRCEPFVASAQKKIASVVHTVSRVGETTLFWDDTGSLSIRKGREIIVRPKRDADARAIRSAILGPAFAVALYQRGQLVLHASAVAIGGGAVVFIGDAGDGKSTTALGLCAAGHCFISDNITAIDLTNDPPVVAPSYPQINVGPEALDALSYNKTHLQYVEPASEKRIVPITERFATRAVPLKQIYVLRRGNATVITPLSPSVGLNECISNSYHDASLEESDAAHFVQCARLATAVPIYEIETSRNFATFPDVLRRIEENIVVVPDTRKRATS